ncbi:MAG: response regulator transcription factor [Spirochaetales bacterium]|nr:response regulator transcription factor [Spirochaetales bacterium]
MKGNVLIIEDEQELADLIALYLEKDGISVSHSLNAEQGLSLIKKQSFDLVTLDINLPGMDGFEFLQAFRQQHTIPVVIVSAREADEDIIMGLGIGADEYVCKPFNPKVLVARIRAMLRRNSPATGSRRIFQFRDFEIDLDGFILKKNAERMALSVKEFEILSFLIENAGKPFTPDEIYNSIWGNIYGDTTTVGVYIQRLRKKIEEDPVKPDILETIHGKGYRFNNDLIHRSST